MRTRTRSIPGVCQPAIPSEGSPNRGMRERELRKNVNLKTSQFNLKLPKANMFFILSLRSHLAGGPQGLLTWQTSFNISKVRVQGAINFQANTVERARHKSRGFLANTTGGVS
ncbi:hypothetical protein KQX54_021384 [Cotesia glomerata]|uniref:Uncharacterized protein n=1 Tax=Cotesia glomerata TaxID=32391 RepID=A0AAV7J8I4_COTGL|nr:hypothetical protein KQX54_021384 [Cotesia glomerata]